MSPFSGTGLKNEIVQALIEGPDLGSETLMPGLVAPEYGPRKTASTLHYSVNKTVGLTLSGGGARGLAHIGVLHVIDSLGLQVDHISGSSMGSIIGALYASGYSAKEIEDIAMRIDWEEAFGMRSDLEYVHIRKRKNSGRAVIELPLEDSQISFKTGVMEGKHLWSILEELFFHVRNIHDFSDFDIPFACIATNIENGNPVVMKQGDIVTALRASMAIPAVFTAIERNGIMLLDGGVSNNYPVDVVKNMGADVVIGVNVSEGLKSAGQLQTPVEVIYQTGLFKNAHIFGVNKEQTDLFLEPGMNGFTAASFSHMEEIIESGKKIARSYYTALDSIGRLNTSASEKGKSKRVERIRSIVIDSVSFQGLINIRNTFISNLANIHPGDTLDANDIRQLKDRFYATDYFERITYEYILSDHNQNRANLIFDFSEKPPTQLMASVHFNSFAGVGIIGGISTYNFLIHNLNARARVRIGEQPAFLTGLDFFIGNNERTWGTIQTTGDIINFPVYNNFKAIGEYKESYIRFEGSINQSTGQNSFFTTGAAFYNQRITPVIETGLHVRGSKQGFETFAKWNKYTLDRHFFSRSGQNLTVDATYFLGQNHSLNIVEEEENVEDMPLMNINIRNFFRLKFNWEYFLPLNSRLTYFTHLQAGYNYSYTQGFIEMFNLGGTFSFLRNQMTFTGLDEFGIMTSSAVTAGLGWHYNVWSEFYLTPVINAALYDFEVDDLNKISKDQLVLGAGLSIGYQSLVGPMKVSFTYSPQTNKMLAYVNLGWSF